MAVTKEFTCPTHGDFTAKFSICPHGCVDVERRFRTAPATIGRRTKNIDLTLKAMAKDYNLTDISNRKGTLAASVAQFQPTPVPNVNPELTMAYMKKQEQQFGGKIEQASDGSYWASNMSFQQGKARVSGDMTTMMGVSKPQIQPRPIVQASYGDKSMFAAVNK